MSAVLLLDSSTDLQLCEPIGNPMVRRPSALGRPVEAIQEQLSDLLSQASTEAQFYQALLGLLNDRVSAADGDSVASAMLNSFELSVCSHLSGPVFHKVRSLMTSVGLNLHFAADEVPTLIQPAIVNGDANEHQTVADVKESLEQATAACQEAADLLTDAETTCGATDRTHNTAYVDTAIGSAVRMLQAARNQTELNLQVDYSVSTPVSAPQKQLTRVLVHLLSKGLDAVSDQKTGWVRLSSWTSTERMFIQVSHNGVNPLTEHNPFHSNSNPDETDLALLMCAEWVRAWGGEMHEQKGADGSTATTFSIPRATQ